MFDHIKPFMRAIADGNNIYMTFIDDEIMLFNAKPWQIEKILKGLHYCNVAIVEESAFMRDENYIYKIIIG